MGLGEDHRNTGGECQRLLAPLQSKGDGGPVTCNCGVAGFNIGWSALVHSLQLARLCPDVGLSGENYGCLALGSDPSLAFCRSPVFALVARQYSRPVWLMAGGVVVHCFGRALPGSRRTGNVKCCSLPLCTRNSTCI